MFAIGFEIVDEELKKALGDKGVNTGAVEQADPIPQSKEDKQEISDDVD
jgi:hypothetical protein